MKLRVLASCAFCLLAVSGFATAEAYKPLIKVVTLKKSAQSDDGSDIRYPVSGNAEVTTLKVVIPVGAVTGWHTHPVPGYAIILSGRLEVELESREKRTYSKGDVVYEVVGRVHQGRNVGSEPVELIAVFTGVKGESVTRKAQSPEGRD